MKIFLAGGTGVLGRRVVERLVRRGHVVAGLARSDRAAGRLEAAGAAAVRVDLFDREGLQAAVRGSDAVLHLATSIPARLDAGRRAWSDNDRIRVEGTANLLAASLSNGVSFYLQAAVTFIYGDRHGAWVDERTPVDPAPAAILRSAVAMEAAVRESAGRGLPATILRFGSFYGPDAAHTLDLLRRVSRRALPILGAGRTYGNLIHVEDAAEATARAIDRHAAIAGEILDVTDGKPATHGEVARFLAEILAAKPPRAIPMWLARLLLPAHVLEVATASHRCRAERVRERLGWAPAFASYREGLAAVAAAIRPGQRGRAPNS